MIIDAQFGFSAQVKKTSRSRQAHANYLGSVPVKVREYAIEEAPIAFWWNSEGDKPVPYHVPVRAIDGELYQPMKNPFPSMIAAKEFGFSFDKQGAANLLTADTVRIGSKTRVDERPVFATPEHLKILAAWLWRDELKKQSWLGTHLPTAPVSRVHEVISTNQHVEAEKISNLFNGIIVVGDILYQRTECPTYAFDPSYGSMTLQARAVGDSRHLATVYGIDRFDDAIAAWSAGAAKYSFRKRSDFNHLRAEIVDASLIPNSDIDFIISTLAERILTDHHKDSYSGMPYLAQLPLETMLAFADFRDFHEASGRGVESVSKMGVFIEHVRPLGLYHREVELFDSVYARLQAEGLVLERELEAGLNDGYGVR